MLKHGIRIAGKSYQVEIYVREGLDSQCQLCNEWGHTQNKCTKTEPTCGICAEKHAEGRPCPDLGTEPSGQLMFDGPELCPIYGPRPVLYLSTSRLVLGLSTLRTASPF
jgi:hypothetical protein